MWLHCIIGFCLKQENLFFLFFSFLKKRPKITEFSIRTVASTRKATFKTKTDKDTAIISKNNKIYALSRNLYFRRF